MFDLLWNVCFSNTFMCNILQKDYSFTPRVPPTHTLSLSLVYSFTTPPYTSPIQYQIYHSPSLSLIWSVGFNDGCPPPAPTSPVSLPLPRNGGLISLLAVWSAAWETARMWSSGGIGQSTLKDKKGRKKSYRSDWIVVVWPRLVWTVGGGGLPVSPAVCLSIKHSRQTGGNNAQWVDC